VTDLRKEGHAYALFAHTDDKSGLQCLVYMNINTRIHTRCDTQAEQAVFNVCADPMDPKGYATCQNGERARETERET
jgi:hypothetical protein